MYNVESEKYLVRPITKDDFEAVKNLLKGNEYLGMLWSASVLPEESLDDIVRKIYMRPDSYCMVEKAEGKFCGYISIIKNDNEGELSVRMIEDMDLGEVMGLFGEVLKCSEVAGHKNLTIQYCFE